MSQISYKHNKNNRYTTGQQGICIDKRGPTSAMVRRTKTFSARRVDVRNVNKFVIVCTTENYLRYFCFFFYPFIIFFPPSRSTPLVALRGKQVDRNLEALRNPLKRRSNNDCYRDTEPDFRPRNVNRNILENTHFIKRVGADRAHRSSGEYR